ncbi:MAG: amidase [Chloroflexi bacterium RBG_13_60_13]|nr:MAG: amidase [Chloroflexi bacterium RBG_13_60_13]
MTDLAALDATAQADLVRQKEVKPIELVNAAIERIERLNPTINAVITPMYDLAIKAASGPLPDGPFTGVPFLLKDYMVAYAGVRLTYGSALLRDYVVDHDSEMVARYKRAGLIVVGRTNLPEFGILPTTEPHFFGPTRNPWNTAHSSGGSSGGSAAAVASGMVPMAHGGDGGGSIRIPASCCGVFGLKPTRGRNPLGPDIGEAMGGLVMDHALTRSVRDSAALLDATAGPDVGDPYWAPPPERPFLREVGADPGRLRIALSFEPPAGTPVHPDCVAAVRDAAKLCADLGHHVEEAAPAINAEMITQAFVAVFTAGVAMGVDAMALVSGRTLTQDQVEPLTWAVCQMAHGQNAPSYLLAHTVLHRIGRDIARFMVDYDVWLTPTLAEPPLPLGTLESTPDNPLAGLMRSASYIPYTPICNITGQPAMSVPLYWNGDGLPIGAHFMARFGDEATLFRLAAQLEKARPWAERRPPLWG